MITSYLPTLMAVSVELTKEWDSSGIIFLKLLAILFLVLLNGFFVASEFAIVKVRSSQLDALIDKGDKKAPFARKVVEHLDAYLSATQLGITLSSLGLGMAGEPFLAKMLIPFFYKFGITSEILIHSVAVAIAFSIITYLHIILGELVPKSLAIQKSVPVTLWVTRPLHWFYILLRPAIWLLNGNANTFLRHVLKVEPAGEHELAHTEEELRVILAESSSANEVTPLGKEILMNALDLKRRLVRDIMTPRGEVVYLDLEEPFEDQLDQAIKSQHTRFPLCRGHLDEDVGLLHIKDLLAQVRRGENDLLDIRRELLHVSENMPLEKLLRFFLGKKAHLAVAVDEYGGAVGIVTLDNVLEELVGTIQDEFDVNEDEVRKINDEEFDIDGSLALYELSDMIHEDIESSDVSTIGGYITSELGHIPSKGEHTIIGSYRATVLDSDGRRVLRVHLKKRKLPVIETDKD
ncbi:MAG: hemolysin family protein [Chthoniobacterales bacterium]